jgi:hypothetical protein
VLAESVVWLQVGSPVGAVLEVNVFGNATTVQRPSPSGYQAMAIPAATLSDVCVDHALEVQFMANVPAPAAAALGDRHATCRRTATDLSVRPPRPHPSHTERRASRTGATASKSRLIILSWRTQHVS